MTVFSLQIKKVTKMNTVEVYIKGGMNTDSLMPYAKIKLITEEEMLQIIGDEGGMEEISSLEKFCVFFYDGNFMFFDA